MSDGASEQLLKALERSKGETHEVLGQAALIAGLAFNDHEACYQKTDGTTSTNPNAFREQWLLKWMVKRLIEASKQGNNLQDFITNARTWSFLSYLLTAIPRGDCLEILLERNFTQILTDVGNSLVKVQELVSSDSSIGQHIDGDERPGKRRRFSPEGINQLASSSEPPERINDDTLLQYVHAVHNWGVILQPEKSKSSSVFRHVMPAWCESVQGAADFVGCVLRCIRNLWNQSTGKTSRNSSASTATLWLRLWHTYATSTNMADRAALPKSFNSFCLVPSLELYGQLSNTRHAGIVAIRSELQRQIALFTILPLKTSFSNKLATVWKLDTGVVSWQDIESTFTVFRDQLQPALVIEALVDQQTSSSLSPSWASHLISITSRLTPREDVRRKQREAPFVQALTLCLAHLSFPREMPKMHKGRGEILHPAEDELPPQYGVPSQWPSQLLRTIATEDVGFSTPIKEYLTTSMLAWRSRPVPLEFLFLLVRLDPNVFVPSVGGENAASCLNSLFLSIANLGALKGSEQQQAIEDIIVPIMEAFAKARDFGGWMNVWLPNLEEALRVRVTSSFSIKAIPVALLWDDEDIMKQFTSLYKLSPIVTFGRGLLKNCIDDVKTMSDRVGPTTDIFAKLAILESVFKARGSEFLRNEDDLENSTLIADLLARAIQEQTDYQSQRWRLWSIMTTLCSSDARLNRFDLVSNTIETTCKRFHSMETSDIGKLPQNQRSALFMEQYMIFVSIVEQYASHRDFNTKEAKSDCDLLLIEIEQIARSIHELQIPKPGLPTSSSSNTDDELWDGRINTLRTTTQLVIGQLAFLVGKLSVADAQSEHWSELLLPVEKRLRESSHKRVHRPSNDNLHSMAVEFLSSLRQDSDGESEAATDFQHLNADSLPRERQSISSEGVLSQPLVDALAADIVSRTSPDESTEARNMQSLAQIPKEPMDMNAVLTVGKAISDLSEIDLKSDSSLAENMAKRLRLGNFASKISTVDFMLRLDLCMLVLKLQPSVVNQANIDNLLGDIAISATSNANIEPFESSQKTDQSDNYEVAIFDRLVGILGLLLARYRRRLTGRSHLLLPALQNLLKCFFYTPSRTYIYQNAATSKQKQAFRNSLPSWLGRGVLPVSSAVKYVKILSSICNPTTALARSAHRGKRKAGSTSLELNDETKKAKRIASQYMQYLIMEYARCSLDGVIQPEVRESLMPGFSSILDAIDKDLMKAMNAAMDPSSRAIFKGLYDDWVKHWKWNQT